MVNFCRSGKKKKKYRTGVKWYSFQITECQKVYILKKFLPRSRLLSSISGPIKIPIISLISPRSSVPRYTDRWIVKTRRKFELEQDTDRKEIFRHVGSNSRKAQNGSGAVGGGRGRKSRIASGSSERKGGHPASVVRGVDAHVSLPSIVS